MIDWNKLAALESQCPVDVVVQLQREYHVTWRDKPESYWFARLMQEAGELGSSLVGDHNDPPDWELMQMAAIILNWLEMRKEQRS